MGTSGTAPTTAAQETTVTRRHVAEAVFDLAIEQLPTTLQMWYRKRTPDVVSQALQKLQDTGVTITEVELLHSISNHATCTVAEMMEHVPDVGATFKFDVVTDMVADTEDDPAKLDVWYQRQILYGNMLSRALHNLFDYLAEEGSEEMVQEAWDAVDYLDIDEPVYTITQEVSFTAGDMALSDLTSAHVMRAAVMSVDERNRLDAQLGFPPSYTQEGVTTAC